MKNEIIYLAGPYSHPRAAIRRHRFELLNEKAAELSRAGNIIFSPISMSHPMAEYGLPKGWEFWGKYDRAFLEVCSKLFVYKIPGWEDSVGVTEEIAIAKELEIPIEYIEYEER
jgi:hypothetical protein